MAHGNKHASRHEYNKPMLKEQIDEAMAAFLRSGKAVERVPTVLAPEPLIPREAPAASDDEPEAGEAPELPGDAAPQAQS
jgi:hypothetical protein